MVRLPGHTAWRGDSNTNEIYHLPSMELEGLEVLTKLLGHCDNVCGKKRNPGKGMGGVFFLSSFYFLLEEGGNTAISFTEGGYLTSWQETGELYSIMLFVKL
jgi:hypothetical protein